MGNKSLVSTHDLRPSERRFVAAMQELGYGRFESLRIQGGEFVLDPWALPRVRITSSCLTTSLALSLECARALAGFLHHQQIIWDKGRTVLTRRITGSNMNPAGMSERRTHPG